jgi:translation initiation factor 3 subunit C
VILSLEESQTAVNENAAVKKKMNATNAKALNTMKQKLKKTIRENEAIIEKYKAVSFLCPSYLFLTRPT